MTTGGQQMSAEVPVPNVQRSITDFFRRPPRQGRPPGMRFETRGRPSQVPRTPPLDVPSHMQDRRVRAREAVRSHEETCTEYELHRNGEENTSTKSKRRRGDSCDVGGRTNWSKGENLERLQKAVQDWDTKSGLYVQANMGVEPSARRYAKVVGIPFATLSRYIRSDVERRQKLGSSVGPRPLISLSEEQFVVDLIRRRDRANLGMSRAEVVDVLQDLRPDLEWKQVCPDVCVGVYQCCVHELTSLTSHIDM